MSKDASAGVATAQTNATDVNLVHTDEIVELTNQFGVLIGRNVRITADDDIIPTWKETDSTTGAIALKRVKSADVSMDRILAILNKKYAGFTEWFTALKSKASFKELAAIYGDKDAKNVKDTVVLSFAMEMSSRSVNKYLVDRIAIDIKFVPLESYETYTAKDGYVFDLKQNAVVTEVDVRIHPEVKAGCDEYAAASVDRNVAFV